jgi:DNA-binding winged helix-turn-helix (wHTH) protein
MPDQVGTSRVIRFATFEVDLQAQELRKAGLRLKLTGQPFQVLAILLEQPGVGVTREELQKRLWPDTFVDVDHNLNTAINKIREALGDSSDNPRFVETLPRRGYRFIAPVNGTLTTNASAVSSSNQSEIKPQEFLAHRIGDRPYLFLAVLAALAVAVGSVLAYQHHKANPAQEQTLTRLTFDDGLQFGATWSPDVRFVAYRKIPFYDWDHSAGHVQRLRGFRGEFHVLKRSSRGCGNGAGMEPDAGPRFLNPGPRMLAASTLALSRLRNGGLRRSRSTAAKSIIPRVALTTVM